MHQVNIGYHARMDNTAPNIFDDSLALRSRQLRFRGVGNPYAFLTNIGILPIKEFIYRGATVVDLAEELNLPVQTIFDWIRNNNYENEIEEAEVISAEGYLSKGQKLLKHATKDFELKKAKLILEQARFMASKKDKAGYGPPQKDTVGPSTVSYVFNIEQQNNEAATQIPAATPTPATEQPLDVVAEEQDDRPAEVAFNLGTPPRHVRDKQHSLPRLAGEATREDPEQDTNGPQDRWIYQ